MENVRFGRLRALSRTLGTYDPSPARVPGLPGLVPGPPPQPWQAIAVSDDINGN